MVTVISFAHGARHQAGQVRLASLCERMGLTHCEYHKNWITESKYYTRVNKKVLDDPIGVGYWAWKPMIILDALQTSEYVVYLDASIMFRNPQYVIDLTAGCDPMMLCEDTRYRNGDWTKQRCYEIMGCTEQKYYDANQLWAAVIACRACIKTTIVMGEWMKYCLDYECVNGLDIEKREGFNAHRDDQSILTNLNIKYNLPTWKLDGRFYDVPI